MNTARAHPSSVFVTGPSQLVASSRMSQAWCFPQTVRATQHLSRLPKVSNPSLGALAWIDLSCVVFLLKTNCNDIEGLTAHARIRSKRLPRLCKSTQDVSICGSRRSKDHGSALWLHHVVILLCAYMPHRCCNDFEFSEYFVPPFETKFAPNRC